MTNPQQPKNITPITAPDDAADRLAKEIIERFCNTANKYAQPKMRPGLGEPLQGLRFPFAPLAHQIRECAKALYPTAAVVTSDECLGEWFSKDTPVQSADTPVANPEPAKAEKTTEVTLESVIAALNGGSSRLSQLADTLGAEPAAVQAVIESPDSGLVISGPSKWVKAA